MEHRISHHADHGLNHLPKKVATLVVGDERIRQSLERLATIVRSKSLVARALDSVLRSRPPVATDVLKLVSTGICGSAPHPVASVHDAIELDGGIPVWRAALLAAYADFVVTALGRGTMSENHVLATQWAIAETAYWVAERHVVEPDQAFTEALLMDSGLVALMYALPEVYETLSRRSDSTSIEDFEARYLGDTHAEVGAELLKQAKFHDDYLYRAFHHHDPAMTLDMTGKVVRAAMVAVSSVGGDFGLGLEPLTLDDQTMEGALLKPEAKAELRDVATSSLSRGLAFEPAPRSGQAKNERRAGL